VTHSAAGTGGTPVSPSLALDGETGVPARPEDADAPSTHQSSVTRRHLLGSGAQIAIALRSTTSLSCAPLGGRGRPPLRGRRDPGCGGFASVTSCCHSVSPLHFFFWNSGIALDEGPERDVLFHGLTRVIRTERDAALVANHASARPVPRDSTFHSKWRLVRDKNDWISLLLSHLFTVRSLIEWCTTLNPQRERRPAGRLFFELSKLGILFRKPASLPTARAASLAASS